uniref:Ionotropic receptor 60a1b n=1 Tax=Heliconius melpomene rosina TaxID=171916 RepID=A0A140G9F9_HELME|nr:ionotropic receptor 60a1b [Heliconius melpomene rosina]
MLVAITLVCFCIYPLNEAYITKVKQSNTEILKQCVCNIVKNYFSNYSVITYLDLYYDSDEIYEALHSLKSINVIQRDKIIGVNKMDESYLIASSNTSTLIKVFPLIQREPSWNPHAYFLLIIKSLAERELKEVFDILLKAHVLNVLVLNGHSDPDIYTYNPYENYGCGRRYHRIIEYGKCLSPNTENWYPYKLVTGLENCTIRVTSPHWPPYSIDPNRRNNSHVGVEEFIFRQMGILEHFQVEFQYSDDAEIFTMINNDMAAVGPMNLIQSDVTDAVLGGMILTHTRAHAFSYVYGHLSYTDEIRYQVQKAQPVPTWKYMYLEFNILIWIVFVLTFITFFLIFITLVKPGDKIRVIFVMFRYLLLNGVRIKGTYFTKYFFLIWIMFAFLINIYYVSSFVSIATDQPVSYQISNEQDMYDYNLKPCVSDLMRNYLLSVENMTLGKNVGENCNGLLDSIQTVSTSSSIYTVVLYSIYMYRRNQFYNRFGNPTTYSFPKPVSKIVYAIYLYKGFPLVEKLTKHAVRLRETGLIEYHLKDLHRQNENKYMFARETRKSHVIFPWQILTVGYVVCSIVFLLEIIISKKLYLRKLILPSQRNVIT